MDSLTRRLLAVSLVILVAAAASAVFAGPGRSWRNNNWNQYLLHKKSTILEKLLDTDRAQALVATVNVVDATGDCAVDIGALLNNKKANLILLAPFNPAFEKLLKLDPGVLDGLDIPAIEAALPQILENNGLTPKDACDVLLKHVSVRDGNVTVHNASADVLLNLGFITVADRSIFPIGVGNPGPHINFEANITERDVFTANGVIHYIDSVLVDAPPPDPPDLDLVCQTGVCEMDTEAADFCETFLAGCIAESLGERECLGGAFLICHEPDEEVPEEGVCTREDCAVDTGLADTCETFLTACLAESLGKEECVGGAYLICLNPFDWFGD